MAREKKEKAPKKEKPPKKERRAKKEKEQKDETLLQKLMRQAKIKGAEPEEPETEEVPEEQEEESGGRKRKLILLIAAGVLALIAVAVVVIFVILPRFSGDKEPEESPEPSYEPVLYDLPESFQVGETTVKAVQPVNPDGVQAEQDVRVSFTYTGLDDAGAEASAYAASLREDRFSVVNEEFVRSDAPDYTTAEGTVLLAKNMPKPETPAAGTGEEGEYGADASASPSSSASPTPEEEQKDMVLTVELTWSEGTMVVTCDQAEGRVTSSPRSESSAIPGAAMSMSEAVDFLYGLEPSVLGLSGESMEGYHIYALDGAVLVNGQPCMRLNVYSREETDQSNDVAGIYLMTRDGQHLYLLDEEARSVTEVKLPPRSEQPQPSEPAQSESAQPSEQPQ